MDYGYGKLEDELIYIFKQKYPDFKKAEELILLGADLNAESTDSCYQEENMLQEVLMGFWETACGRYGGEKCPDIPNLCCANCPNSMSDDELGLKMEEIVHWFLSHGFDVTKYNNRYGAQCLYALTFSTFDKYMLSCAKILLNAGAKNAKVFDDEDEDVLSAIADDSFFNSCCEGNDAYANILEAYYQLVDSCEKGQPYEDIDSYEVGIGKRITGVFILPEDATKPLFYDIDFANSKHKNCYTSTLFITYEDGYLQCTKYSEIWSNKDALPTGIVNVSELFAPILNSTITDIRFSQTEIKKDNTRYAQPGIYIHTGKGPILKMRINFGEVAEDDRAAYYEIINENTNSN